MAKKKLRRERVGRPLKLTKEIQEILFDGLEVGMSYAAASMRAGITDQTRINWVNRGREVYQRLESLEEEVELTTEEYEYFQFFVAHEQAVAESQNFHLVNLYNQSQQDARHSHFVLERRWPDDFGPPIQRREISGRDGKPIETKDVSELSLAERAAAIQALINAAKERKETADDPGNG